MDGGSLTGTNGDPLDHQSVVGNIVSQSVSQQSRWRPRHDSVTGVCIQQRATY